MGGGGGGGAPRDCTGPGAKLSQGAYDVTAFSQEPHDIIIVKRANRCFILYQEIFVGLGDLLSWGPWENAPCTPSATGEWGLLFGLGRISYHLSIYPSLGASVFMTFHELGKVCFSHVQTKFSS